MTALAILAAVFIIQTRSNDAAERDAVRHILAVTFDKPDSPLGIEAIVVRDGVAIADWIQGDRGGRALLRRGGDAWSIILCGGDGLKDVSTLQQVGLSPDRAKALSDDLSLAEAKLSSARLALISSFDGLVRIDQGGAHPPPAHH
jgi:hypothetical protein